MPDLAPSTHQPGATVVPQSALRPLAVTPPDSGNPILLYLGQLAPGSRPAMTGALGRVAAILLGLQQEPGETAAQWQLRQRRASLCVP
jgi:hypothetical protein